MGDYENIQRRVCEVMAKSDWTTSRMRMMPADQIRQRRSKTTRSANDFIQNLLQNRRQGDLDDDGLVDKYELFLKSKKLTSVDTVDPLDFEKQLANLTRQQQLERERLNISNNSSMTTQQQRFKSHLNRTTTPTSLSRQELTRLPNNAEYVIVDRPRQLRNASQTTDQFNSQDYEQISTSNKQFKHDFSRSSELQNNEIFENNDIYSSNDTLDILTDQCLQHESNSLNSSVADLADVHVTNTSIELNREQIKDEPKQLVKPKQRILPTISKIIPNNEKNTTRFIEQRDESISQANVTSIISERRKHFDNGITTSLKNDSKLTEQQDHSASEERNYQTVINLQSEFIPIDNNHIFYQNIFIPTALLPDGTVFPNEIQSKGHQINSRNSLTNVLRCFPKSVTRLPLSNVTVSKETERQLNSSVHESKKDHKQTNKYGDMLSFLNRIENSSFDEFISILDNIDENETESIFSSRFSKRKQKSYPILTTAIDTIHDGDNTTGIRQNDIILRIDEKSIWQLTVDEISKQLNCLRLPAKITVARLHVPQLGEVPWRTER
ncbi:unnamed protein product [Didymodactylos carnosus]|uniref:PDZ domain-containing protein n=1 Tax=Didymodactylos carnosus TaxID=1234261 RepID=A0A813U7B8_9BILA|nr:unnamed protein product [Didymodactylos carnosus]CAF3609252.1 unnamed protein product [Didymodactylos carnosus]